MTGYDMADAIRDVITEQREDITALKAENNRLRELCKEWYRYARGLFDEFIGEPDADEDFMTLEDRLREMGVEP